LSNQLKVKLFLALEKISKLVLNFRNIVEKRKNFLPHIGIILFAVIAGSINIVSARQVDEYATLALSDPASVEQIITEVVSPYTLKINDTEIFNTSQSLAIDNGFISKPQAVETKITDRRSDREIELAKLAASKRTKTISYNVANGDTLSGIGWQFDVKLATLKYVNDLSNIDTIKPGQTIKIPPSNYEVPQKQIDQRERKLALARSSTSSSNRSTSKINVDTRKGYVNNGYPYGWCTYYVATRRQVPTSMGNAGRWLSSAKAQGMSTGEAPAVGSIVVTNESWAGHVAIVDGVGNGTITITEMNYAGWGRVSSRTISQGSGVIKGYIY
jgi:surface antigen